MCLEVKVYTGFFGFLVYIAMLTELMQFVSGANGKSMLCCASFGSRIKYEHCSAVNHTSYVKKAINEADSYSCRIRGNNVNVLLDSYVAVLK
jgi:hypothetical protein